MLTSPYIVKNFLLAAISEADYPTLFENLELIDLPFQKTIYHASQTIDYVYFPIQSVVSLISTSNDQSTSEVALIGREGLVGLPAFLGHDQANSQALVLTPGPIVRVYKNIFVVESRRPGHFRDQLLAYTQARLNQLSQNIACKSHHTIQQQFARWLLSVHDQVEGDQLLLTQPFIAQLFGIRRASITEAAIKLQDAGYISYRRGKITILDPEGLKSVSCRCYGIVKTFFDQNNASCCGCSGHQSQ